ncbi:MAG TPA: tetratricopeptide repeat protein [Hyphomicrobiaceae bacterium]|nr:tetratricopeptide repeat protein [Hyphomicrobiaceae bacterium]
MLSDRYGNGLTTASGAARDAYVAAVDLLLSANPGAEQAFERAIAFDPGLAVAHAGLARALQIQARPQAAKAAIARGLELAPGLSARERGHLEAFGLLIEGKAVEALAAARQHLDDYPCDAMVLAPLTSVFGLIGFSGRAGREGELLALMDSLAMAYGEEDWWFLCMHAFAQVECGQIEKALANIERSLAQYPRNAHGAHIRAHVYYESGERSAGLAYLRDWWASYPKESQLHCHLAWHIALWELELGRAAEAWEVYHAHLRPGASWGPPINTLTDSASFLFRAELAGEARNGELWRELSAYASASFPTPGVTFADVHGALAHALAGNGEALAQLESGARGPAADMVRSLARAFEALRRGAWAEASACLQPIIASHERIGGSRAQRDLIEYTLALCLVRAGRSGEAHAYLRRRRLAGPEQWPLAGVRI